MSEEKFQLLSDQDLLALCLYGCYDIAHCCGGLHSAYVSLSDILQLVGKPHYSDGVFFFS